MSFSIVLQHLSVISAIFRRSVPSVTHYVPTLKYFVYVNKTLTSAALLAQLVRQPVSRTSGPGTNPPPHPPAQCNEMITALVNFVESDITTYCFSQEWYNSWVGQAVTPCDWLPAGHYFCKKQQVVMRGFCFENSLSL